MLNSNFTWQGLKELLDLIAGCGYFERVQEEAGKVSETGPVGDAEFEVVEHTDVPAPDSDEVQASLPPDVPEEVEPLPDSTQQKQVLTHCQLHVQAHGHCNIALARPNLTFINASVLNTFKSITHFD